MRKMNKSIIKYTTTITDNLYYLLPLELLLGFLWGISWGSLWIMNQTSSMFSWDVLEDIRDSFQTGQSLLSQMIVVVFFTYLVAHLFLCLIWIKEDKILNLFRTLNETCGLRKRMRIIETKEVDEVLNQYHKAVQSVQCLITSEDITISVPKKHIEEIDTKLKEKLNFSSNYLIQRYKTLFSFSNITETSKIFHIQGSKTSSK
ncbi:hypothetical protein ACS6YF_11425 [Streptococcus suis]